ncbi:hypothetical protein FGB62_169g235 [Gracilaria domingensis]|nr:hypothetical protein FGB62_169g235 [Gracilaria domingensis]
MPVLPRGFRKSAIAVVPEELRGDGVVMAEEEVEVAVAIKIDDGGPAVLLQATGVVEAAGDGGIAEEGQRLGARQRQTKQRSKRAQAQRASHGAREGRRPGSGKRARGEARGRRGEKSKRKGGGGGGGWGRKGYGLRGGCARAGLGGGVGRGAAERRTAVKSAEVGAATQ